MYIYKTTNLVNSKIYIGKTQMDNNEDYYGSGKILINAIKKYGVKNFKREKIEDCKSIEELNEREKFWIDKLNTNDPKFGYNVSSGDEGRRKCENLNKKIQVLVSTNEANQLTNIILYEKINNPGFNPTLSSYVRMLIKNHIKEKQGEQESFVGMKVKEILNNFKEKN